ncbi:Peptidase M12A [Trinorchestia longiramus]|nr:Peptidase M12A [Trinorchestia longiramus]
MPAQWYADGSAMRFFPVIVAAFCVASSSANITRIAIPDEATDWRSDFFRKNPNISLESLIPIRNHDDQFLLNYDFSEDDTETLKALWPGGLLNWKENSDGWPEVPYRFGSKFLLSGSINTAIRHWEEHTCIKFRDVTQGGLYPHVVFETSSSSCFSRIGRIFFLITGQSILLTTACQLEVGTVIHEIGHALGLFHEQARWGREEYIQILWKNMRLSELYNNFPKITENYGVPYDYSSIMHYGMLEFSNSGRSVLVTTNQMAQGLLFLNEELSHMDKKLVNIQYSCIGECTELSMYPEYTGILPLDSRVPQYSKD